MDVHLSRWKVMLIIHPTSHIFTSSGFTPYNNTLHPYTLKSIKNPQTCVDVTSSLNQILYRIQSEFLFILHSDLLCCQMKMNVTFFNLTALFLTHFLFLLWGLLWSSSLSAQMATLHFLFLFSSPVLMCSHSPLFPAHISPSWRNFYCNTRLHSASYKLLSRKVRPFSKMQ